MSTNYGQVIPCMSGAINAAITHSKRVNKEEDKKTSSTEFIKYDPVDYKGVSSQKEILEELKRVLEQRRYKDDNSISIYSLMKLMRKKYNEWKYIENDLCFYIERKTDNDVFFLHLDFDCENKYLIIQYHGNEAFFTKKDGDLIIVKSAWSDAKNILGNCGDEISKCYDKFIEDISFHRDYMRNIKSTNSNFIVNTDKYGICISESKKYSSDFKMMAKLYESEYDYDCNSNNITNICRNNEDEIFKRIFIKIEDCPEWVRASLYGIRKNELVEKQKIEEKLRKKQKRLELTRKIFPFLKK